MELTDFDVKTFENIENLCVVGKWYSVKKDRDDYEKLLESVTKFGFFYGIMEIIELEDRFKYKITLRYNAVEEKIKDMNDPVFYSKKDNFYTKAYDKETLEKQIKKDSSTKKSDIPGVCSRPDLVKNIMDIEKLSKDSLTKEHKEKLDKIKKFREWTNQN